MNLAFCFFLLTLKGLFSLDVPYALTADSLAVLLVNVETNRPYQMMTFDFAIMTGDLIQALPFQCSTDKMDLSSLALKALPFELNSCVGLKDEVVRFVPQSPRKPARPVTPLLLNDLVAAHAAKTKNYPYTIADLTGNNAASVALWSAQFSLHHEGKLHPFQVYPAGVTGLYHLNTGLPLAHTRQSLPSNSTIFMAVAGDWCLFVGLIVDAKFVRARIVLF
jgi:hypothetical protein